jgi:hypothetical protein
MKYRIILGGNSADSKIVRMGFKSHNFCRDLFKRLQILTFPCEYIYSLIKFIRNNKELFQMNVSVHSVNTRHKYCLHKPLPTSHDFKKALIMLGSKLSITYHLISNVLKMKKLDLK